MHDRMNRVFRAAVLSLLIALPVLFASGALPDETAAPALVAHEEEHVVAAPENWAWD
ncbi:hypothetical protein [Streptomyces sp. NBC_01233]|uniref:hypothetical protein n=1 Tax=Streptomyces sp. NBC_01233 TaxID=2903787 RepID=UPI002E11EAEB|nr:hypothetical protein OG332_43600 [Streptomyces sp. NBC_01233]